MHFTAVAFASLTSTRVGFDFFLLVEVIVIQLVSRGVVVVIVASPLRSSSGARNFRVCAVGGAVAQRQGFFHWRPAETDGEGIYIY